LAQHLQYKIQETPGLAEKLEKALVGDPPLALKEGGIFRDEYDADLDALRQGSREGKIWISQLQEREIAATGIKSLKVRYKLGVRTYRTTNRILRMCRALRAQANDRRCERFVTPELKKIEAKILGADERARQLEYQLFQNCVMNFE